jgi:hypothetical protein
MCPAKERRISSRYVRGNQAGCWVDAAFTLPGDRSIVGARLGINGVEFRLYSNPSQALRVEDCCAAAQSRSPVVNENAAIVVCLPTDVWYVHHVPYKHGHFSRRTTTGANLGWKPICKSGILLQQKLYLLGIQPKHNLPGGRAMAAALQINLALWGMIACAAIKVGQMLGVGF